MEFDIKVVGSARILHTDYVQNPKTPEQNFWRVTLKNGQTETTVIVPLRRDPKVSKAWRKKLAPGNTLSFEGVPDRDTIFVTAIHAIKTQPRQAAFILDEIDEAIARIAA